MREKKVSWAAILLVGLVFFTSSPAVTAATIYLGEEGTRSLNLYDENSHLFLGTLTGPNAAVIPLGIPYGMTQAPDGHVFVADAGGGQAFEFYNRTLVQSIAVPQGGSTTDPQGVAIAPTGDLIVSNFNGQIVDFAFGEGYDAATTLSSIYSVIPGARAGMVFDSSGNLFVSTSPNGSAVYKVPPGVS